MWQHIFGLGTGIGEKILRAALVYLFLVLALRLAGKRELAQLSTTDFVVLLTLSNAVQNGIIGDDNSVSGAVIGGSTLLLLNSALAVLLYRRGRLRRLVVGSPRALITGGTLDEAALRRERLTEEELLEAVQSAGVRRFADVAEATIKPDGHIVVVLRESSMEHDDVVRRLEELTALVRAPRSPA